MYGPGMRSLTYFERVTNKSTGYADSFKPYPQRSQSANYAYCGPYPSTALMESMREALTLHAVMSGF